MTESRWTMSERDRNEDDLDLAMIDLDLHLTYTGGGCTALEGHCPNDERWLITVADDPMAPESMEEPVLVGYYWNDGENWVSREFPTLRLALAFIAKHRNAKPTNWQAQNA